MHGILQLGKKTMETTQQNKLFEMAPILVFIIAYFIFHLFSWSEATQTILAVFFSLLSFFVLASDFKSELKDKKIKLDVNKLNYFSGLLTVIFLLLFAQGFLHWKSLLPLGYRMAIQYLLLLIYFIAAFRAMRVLISYKRMAETKK